MMEKETLGWKERERIDKLLDSSLEATFPASDAVSLTQPGADRRSSAPASLLGVAS
jgi:hypothetical protein